LKQSAIEQQSFPRRFHEIFRAGHATRRTQESQFRHPLIPSKKISLILLKPLPQNRAVYCAN
jgi:hypothetical protein